MSPTRRGFLSLLGAGAAVLAAPAIVRAGNIMPVKLWTPSDWFLEEYITCRLDYGRIDGMALRLWSGNLRQGASSYTGEFGWEYCHAVRFPALPGEPSKETLIEAAKPYLETWKRQLERDLGREIALGRRRLSPHEFQKRAA